MIDPADKQTAALPLEEQPAKRGRGRPATGKAMTPAEKQKAYRERLKAKQAEGTWETAEMMRLEILRLEKELAEAKRALREKGNVTNRNVPYEVQSWDIKRKKWAIIGEDDPDNVPFDNWQKAEEFVMKTKKDGSTSRYRIIPAYLPVTEYR